MSSCQKGFKKKRERDIYNQSKNFIKQIVVNMCVPEGFSGHVDLAFHVERKRIIAKALRDLSKELVDEDKI